jgi:RNA polymerase sporulation-specific sigma factor
MYETNLDDIIAAQKGNKEAMEKLLKNNNGLTWSIVKRFAGRGYEIEDLYQIGCMGFIKAIKRFDTSFEVKISTYAVPYILGEIKRFIRDDGLIKVSRSIKELYIKIKEVEKEYIQKEGKDITINLLAEKLKVTKEEIAVALDSSKAIESINDEGKDNNKLGKIESISTGRDEANMIINRLSIGELIGELQEREKEIIVLRYFKEKTQTEVAKILGITQVQVSRIEKRILQEMRNEMKI